MKSYFLACAPVLATAMVWLFPTTARAQLKPGDIAPDFKLKGTDGKTYTLSQFRGKKAVVLAWYPKAFTGG